MKRFFLLLMTTVLLLPSQVLPAKAIDCFARGAVVLEAVSGTVLYEKNGDLPLPEASTTKIMTALLVLERADLEAEITISPAAAAVEGSRLGLTAGEKLSVSDLLYILMLKSGNDAAHALAEGVGGSVARFVQMMNQKAMELGLKNTLFQNPHGLPDENHYTTAYDLATLTAVALQNPEFCNIVSAEKRKLTYKNKVIANSNKLLGTCEGVFGVKTGFTKKAGRCLVTAAERKGVTLICVTLNDGNDWADHAALYEACFARVERVEVMPAKGYISRVPVLGGSPALVTNSLPLYGLSLDGELLPYLLEETSVPRVFAPVEQHRTLGEVKVVAPTGRAFSASPLNAKERVEQKKEERTFFGSFFLKLRKLWKYLTSKTAF